MKTNFKTGQSVKVGKQKGVIIDMRIGTGWFSGWRYDIQTENGELLRSIADFWVFPL
jgi:hypothetical protein